MPTTVATITDIPISDVTTGEITGAGAFDKFMTAIKGHLEVEYKAKRINSDKYPDVYLGAMQTALTQAVTFALQAPIVLRQASSEEAKRLLIERQTKGFDDDAKQKLLKQALDSWSVAYSVAKDANSIPDAIKVGPIDQIMKNAMGSLGMIPAEGTNTTFANGSVLDINPLGEAGVNETGQATSVVELPPPTISYSDQTGLVKSLTSTAATTDDATPAFNIGSGLIATPKLYVNNLLVESTYDKIGGTLRPTNNLQIGQTYVFNYSLVGSDNIESAKSLPFTLTITL